MAQDKQPFPIVNMLRTEHKEFPKPVCMVSHSTLIMFEGEAYLPYPFTVEVLGEESVEFGGSMPLGVLRRIGKCHTTLFSPIRFGLLAGSKARRFSWFVEPSFLPRGHFPLTLLSGKGENQRRCRLNIGIWA